MPSGVNQLPIVWLSLALPVAQLERQLQDAQSQLAVSGGGQGHLRALAKTSEINSLPLSKLEALRQQIRGDLDHLDSVSLSLVNKLDHFLESSHTRTVCVVSLLEAVELNMVSVVTFSNCSVSLSLFPDYPAEEDHAVHEV